MMIIHYEVYVQEPRGWMLHARHPRQEREVALAEAKELEQLNLQVRIVRECYYTDSNKFEESDIYVTGKSVTEKYRGSEPSNLQSRPSAAPAKRPPPAKPRPASAQPPRSRPNAPKPAAAALPAAGPVVARLLPILALAVGLAMASVRITPDVILVLWQWGLQVNLQQENYERLQITIFILVFLMVAVPLCLRFLPKLSKGRQTRRRATAVEIKAAADANRAAELKRSLDKLAATALAEETAKWQEPEAKTEEEPPPPSGLDEEDLPEIRPDPEEEEPPPNQQAEVTDKAAEAPPPAENHRSTLMAFVGGAVNAVKSVAAVLDNYNKFALHLYLAGCVEALCEIRKLGANERAQLTTAALETLGTSHDMARKFQGKMGEYLMEPQYMRMMLSGRTAMEEFLGGREAGAHSELKAAIKEWNRPTEKVKTSIITVMFTDMVGSTDLTQAKGDAAAQEVVRRHNTIVRTALAQFAGREIKHTGDGIMASFASAAGAVEASVVIQRNVTAHNERMPQQTLHLRIGLNAGEPIQEEDDLFGTTVQLAARVCAATDTDQILCTGVVKELGQGKGATFKPAGSHALKGFKEKFDLFEVVWRG